MPYEVIELNESQIPDIEERLEAYDEKHISYKLSGSVCIGVTLDGELIAGAVGCMTAFRIFYVSTVYVDENHRGKGVGRQLITCIEKRAAALGANLIRLDTFDWQGAAFYQKLGYEQVGHYESAADGFSEFFFLKRI